MKIMLYNVLYCYNIQVHQQVHQKYKRLNRGKADITYFLRY